MSFKRDFDFYNELGEKYPESKVVYSTESGKLRKTFLTQLFKDLTGSLLDLGCNNYTYEPYWNGSYVGVDLANKVLKTYHRNGIQSDICLLPFRNGIFDYVLMSEVFEHLTTSEQRLQCLNEICRVLKGSGEALVTVPMGMRQRGPDSRVWFPILEKYGVTPYKYVHGNYSEETMRTYTDKTRLVIVEVKHLLSTGDNHTFFRLEKVN